MSQMLRVIVAGALVVTSCTAAAPSETTVPATVTTVPGQEVDAVNRLIGDGQQFLTELVNPDAHPWTPPDAGDEAQQKANEFADEWAELARSGSPLLHDLYLEMGDGFTQIAAYVRQLNEGREKLQGVGDEEEWIPWQQIEDTKAQIRSAEIQLTEHLEQTGNP